MKRAGQPPRSRTPGRRTKEPRRLGGSDLAAHHYRAIVESSDDAILSKDLNGTILSWNNGAERLFGFTAQHAVGKPVTIIIPLDRNDEERLILEKIRCGQRIDHFETVRQRKDGSFVDISLTISPIRDFARKYRRRLENSARHNGAEKGTGATALTAERNELPGKEFFALSGSIVGLSARSAKNPRELVDATRARLSALARAHALTFSHGFDGSAPQPTTLQSLIRTIVAPFDDAEHSRITLSGTDAGVSGSAVTSLALLLHEFATNATKYGALSSTTGMVKVVVAEEGDAIVVHWTERGGPPASTPGGAEGFGGVLSRITVSDQLGGEIVRDWQPEGLAIRLSVRRSRLET